MKRCLTILAAVGCASSIAAFAGCATDEAASPGGEPSGDGDRLPPLDAGADAALADAPESEPCTPDVLCPGGPFDPSTAGGALDLRARINVIRGRSVSDVWAVGARGAVAHFDGTSWRRSALGDVATLNGIWLRDGQEIALASFGSVYSRGLEAADAGAPSADGWTAHPDPPVPTDVSKISRGLVATWTAPGADWLWCGSLENPTAGSPPSRNGLWRFRVVPESGSVEFARAFAPGMCGIVPCANVTSIHGVSADDLWAVGFTGAIVHVTRAQSDAPEIEGFDSQTWSGFGGVWAAAENDVWAVGGAGVIRHYTGKPTTWDIVTDVPTTADLRAIWGTSASDIWAVGDGAVVLHYDGSSWSSVKVVGLGARRPDLYTVWTPEPGRVWAGGDGVILSLGGKP